MPETWYNLALLPSTNSNAPFKAYMPVSMAANLGVSQPQTQQSLQQPPQPPPMGCNQCVAPPQTGRPLTHLTGKSPCCALGELVDVTPKCPPNPVPPSMPPFAPCQTPLLCPEPFPTVRPYYRLPREPYDPYRPRRSQSKRKNSKKRSKTPKKAKPHEREHTESPSKDGKGKKKSRSPSPPQSKSPRSKPLKSAGPGPLSTSTGPLSSVTPTQLPPPPTVEQLQSAVLRPVQPRPKPYSIETAQTLPMPATYLISVEPEKVATRERSRTPERRLHPCHCMPMIYCMPSCPYPCHQLRSPRADRRIQRLLEMCEGVSLAPTYSVKEEAFTHSCILVLFMCYFIVFKKNPIKVQVVKTPPSDQSTRSVLPNITTEYPHEMSPLRTIIKTSPPPQQPLNSQALFGMKKATDDEDRGEFRAGRPPSRRGAPPLQPPPPPPPPPLQGGSTLSTPNRGNPAPRLGPKPTIQWPPRIRPGGSDKPTSPPIIEFGGVKRISESSDDCGGGGASQVEGSYEVIWDYFSENGGETDEEGGDREVGLKGGQSGLK
ncbi:unnamed protein product [Hydatigera taeniaeformis]|uniref:Uncharacterized protein n=1 Tax=Hydatigena taeniaeformis TaxID=6205 RepID=A0A3P7FFR6_HYDTA|nr:unnamed protein product [Hydatigera taeniaeformis]